MPDPSDITPDTRLTVSEAALSTSIPGEIVILDPESGQYFGLEGVAARAWELLEATATFGEMVRTISDEYEVDAATCERDIRSLLTDLLARNLARIV